MDSSTSLHQYFENICRVDPTVNPLYFSSLWGWCRLWGYSDTACRSLSLLFGLLSIAASIFAARDFFGNRRESLLVGLLLAISTMNFFFCRETRMYSLYMLLSALSILGVTRMLKQMKHGTLMSAAANAFVYPVWVPRYTLYSLYALIVCMIAGTRLFGGGVDAVLNGSIRMVRPLILGGIVLLFGVNWLVMPPP